MFSNTEVQRWENQSKAQSLDSQFMAPQNEDRFRCHNTEFPNADLLGNPWQDRSMPAAK